MSETASEASTADKSAANQDWEDRRAQLQKKLRDAGKARDEAGNAIDNGRSAGKEPGQLLTEEADYNNRNKEYQIARDNLAAHEGRKTTYADDCKKYSIEDIEKNRADMHQQIQTDQFREDVRGKNIAYFSGDQGRNEQLAMHHCYDHNGRPEIDTSNLNQHDKAKFEAYREYCRTRDTSSTDISELRAHLAEPGVQRGLSEYNAQAGGSEHSTDRPQWTNIQQTKPGRALADAEASGALGSGKHVYNNHWRSGSENMTTAWKQESESQGRAAVAYNENYERGKVYHINEVRALGPNANAFESQPTYQARDSQSKPEVTNDTAAKWKEQKEAAQRRKQSKSASSEPTPEPAKVESSASRSSPKQKIQSTR